MPRDTKNRDPPVFLRLERQPWIGPHLHQIQLEFCGLSIKITDFMNDFTPVWAKHQPQQRCLHGRPKRHKENPAVQSKLYYQQKRRPGMTYHIKPQERNAESCRNIRRVVLLVIILEQVMQQPSPVFQTTRFFSRNFHQMRSTFLNISKRSCV